MTRQQSGLVVLVLALAILVALQALAVGPPPLWRPLNEQEQKVVAKWRAQFGHHIAKGEFEEAVRLAKQIAEYRNHKQGKRHYEAINARLDVDYWQRLCQVAKKDRAEVVESLVLTGEGLLLLSRVRYREAEAKHR